MRNRRFARAGASLLLALAGLASPAGGQEDQLSRACVSEDLPIRHWSVEVVQRLQALGLTDYTSNDQVVNGCRVESALEEALLRAGSDPKMRRLLESWRSQLAVERRGAGEDTLPSLLQLTSADLSLGISGSDGSAAPGFGEFDPDRTGAEPLPDGVRATSRWNGSARLLSRLHISAALTSSGSELLLDRLEITAPLGPLTTTIGRGYNRLGYAKGGSIVYSGVAPLDRFEISTRSPFFLPGPLRRVGGLSLTTWLATVSDDRHVDDPYFWAMRGTVQPHPRLLLAVNRAALFGGDQRMRLDNLGMMLLGRVQGKGFEDQIVSVEGWFRLPTETVLPLTLVVEWGAEDAAGAWWAVPGIVVSVQTPSIPGAEEVSAAVEYATFGTSCCLNPEWYRHWSFPGSWALGDLPMGHPLGGNGSEWLLTTSAHLNDATLRLKNDLFTRDRRGENLYVPGRGGRSFGLRSGAEWRLRSGFDLNGAFSLEAGEGWSDESVTLQGKLYF